MDKEVGPMMVAFLVCAAFIVCLFLLAIFI